MSTPPPALRYGVIVPVKPPAVAKSRLGALGDDARQALVVAFALDTITAALGSPLVETVLAVTDDHMLARRLAEAGASVIPDATTDNLNSTLVQSAAEQRRRHPGLGSLALCADLPSLRSEELTRVLASAGDGAGQGMAFVADADGVGTTAVLALDLTDFRPMFGPGSRAAHLASGAREVDLSDVPSLRRDVDTPADLRAALALGVGAHTSAVTAGLRL